VCLILLWKRKSMAISRAAHWARETRADVRTSEDSGLKACMPGSRPADDQCKCSQDAAAFPHVNSALVVASGVVDRGRLADSPMQYAGH
jgi:hypothetical protein